MHVISAFSSREIHEQGRKMVRGDTDGTVRHRRDRLSILADDVRGSAGGAVSAGAEGAFLGELADLPNIRHNIPSDDTAEHVRDDRDGQGGTGVPHRPRPGPPGHGNWP